MVKVFRDGLREIGRKLRRVRLRRMITAAGRDRDSKLVALGRQAWDAKVMVPTGDDLAERIAGTATQEQALSARRMSLAEQRKEHEDKREEESSRFGALEQEVKERKAPVDADLAARRAERARAQNDLESARRRLEAIAASRRALEAPAADRPTVAQPPMGQATTEAQMAALAREQTEIEARLGPLTETQGAAAANVQKLEVRVRELQAELDAIAAERRRALGEIDQGLAGMRRALNEASAEGASIQKQQVAHFKDLGIRLLASAVDEPALSEAMAAVRTAGRHRQDLQTAMDGLVAESKAVPRWTMLKFTAMAAASLVLVLILAALRPAPRIPEFIPSVEVPRDPVRVEMSPTGDGTIDVPGVASVAIPSGALPGQATVTVAATMSPETAAEFRETAVLFAPGPRVPYEVRINTGIRVPRVEAEVRVRLVLPESLTRALPPNYAVRVFAQFMQDSREEVHDSFMPLELRETGDRKSVEIGLRRNAFTNLRNRDRTFEAVIVVGSSRVGPAPPLRRRGQSTFRVGASAAAALDLGWLRDLIDDLVKGPDAPCKQVCPAWKPPVVPPTVNPRRPYNPDNDHYGADYRAADGQAVFAVAPGRIVSVNNPPVRALNQPSSAGLMTRGWGLHVVIEHCDGSRTLYAHLKSGSTDSLRAGHFIAAGEQIGEADSTGAVTGPHLHMEYAPSGKRGSANTADPHPCSYSQ